MMARQLLCLALVRYTRQQGKEEDTNILGKIEMETDTVEPFNIRALCYEGLGKELSATKCTMLDPRSAGCLTLDKRGRETWDPEACAVLPKGSPYFMDRSYGWNQAVSMNPAGESSVMCLQCCNAVPMAPCASKNGKRRKCKSWEGVNEFWPFRCQVPGRPLGDAMRNALYNSYYGYEFRFARNQGNRAMDVPHYEDRSIVKCALPRMGCQYEYPRPDDFESTQVKYSPASDLEPHPGYGDATYEFIECCTDKMRHLRPCAEPPNCMASQVAARGYQTWISVFEAAEILGRPVPPPPGRVALWEAKVQAVSDASVTLSAASASPAISAAICDSNSTTPAAEEAKCSELSTAIRSLEMAQEDEALAAKHRDRRDLACSSRANSFEASDDFGWKQQDYLNRTEYKCALPGSVYGGEGPFGLPDGTGSERDQKAKKYENPVAERDKYMDGIRARGLESACNFRDARDRERGTYFLKGYELTIFVEEKSSNAYGFWKSVTGCNVEVTEVEQLYVDGDISQSTPDESQYFQRIILRQRYSATYDFYNPDQGLPFIIIGVGILFFIVSRIVQCVRDEPCPTCGTRLIIAGLSELAPYPLDKPQCALCRFYGAEMPDPVLLARMKARSKFVHGRGFFEFATTPDGGRPRGFCGWVRLYVVRCIRASVIMTAYGVYNVLRWVFVLLLMTGDCVLHFVYRCVLRKRRGPGPVCLRTFIPKDEDIVDDDPPVPTKIYVADPHLRSENAFLAMTRPVHKPERRLVSKEQAYVRRTRAEGRRKKVATKRTRLRYAMQYLGANSEKDVAQLAKLDGVVARLDEEIAVAKIAEKDDILKEAPPDVVTKLTAAQRRAEMLALEGPPAEAPPPVKKVKALKKEPEKFAVASAAGVGNAMALFVQERQKEFVNGVRVVEKKKDS